ncbi:hypothetical protein [Streptococcus sanguinis]|jgi:hypothetical protein|uniref:Uncharacterized protein n=1 Tax=Streptococcus sanguinis SK1056 TaxID=888820 RepID=F3U9H2_STRSA|nr:hypothetical protein [Streptococcus sanguinis]EGJ40277.1 hypothetical protein HMPREF9393_0275 [Streptococcus sanguinis SK1056]MCY7013056.1 hypothetical protein [Streptococcus sanguinis]MCY7025627.1 hypothetical protein [Streptococcus sanguinis]
MEILAMKKYLEMILQRANEFISGKKNEQGPEDSGRILRTIELALRKQSGVHVIFLDKSFTGDIVKYDRERQQLIIKNFKKSMTTIIRVQDIKRISLVPNNIREAQKKDIRITSHRFKR